jgi:pilus assembly protein CpaF
LEKGKMILKPQTISKVRREQLVRAFLLLTPEERLDKEFHEVYMLDGTRITIFRGVMTKKDQDVIIFRRYTVPIYTFEEQANRGTIPKEAISLFKNMVDIGYNVAFTGAVRTAKSTFLSTWQSYESQDLEGVMVETDPEIPLHQMMKHAPIIQIIADNEKLKAISKNLLRSDADYFIMAEARDGIALDTVLKMAAKGTRRMKITFHSRDPVDFCYDVSSEIFKMLGGSPQEIQQKVAKSFDYIFHFIQLADKSQKRLKGIFELGIDPASGHIKFTQICRYQIKEDSWQWQYFISPDKRLAGIEENTDSFIAFERELEKLCYETSYAQERSIYERRTDLRYEGNKASEAII